MINYELAKERGIWPSEVKQLEVHYGIIKLLHSIPISQVKEYFTSISNYNKAVQDTEYAIQSLWQFTQNIAYHRMWFEDPKCKCPYEDNKDRLGVTQRITSELCPLHGGHND